jgi:hypothetical protein
MEDFTPAAQIRLAKLAETIPPAELERLIDAARHRAKNNQVTIFDLGWALAPNARY